MEKQKGIKIDQSAWMVKVAEKAKVKVKKGDSVKRGDVLAILVKRRVKRLSFPRWLDKKEGIWKLGGKRGVGEEVRRGDLLYEKGGLFGRRRWFSSEEGKIIAVREKEGFLKIAGKRRADKLISPLAGKVASVSSGQIKIIFPARVVLGRGIGKERAWGILSWISDEYPLTKVSHQSKGKILLVNEINFPLLKKSAVLGAAGIVGFSFPEWKMVEEEPSLPVLLLEKEEGLIKQEGKICFLDAPASQLLICYED